MLRDAAFSSPMLLIGSILLLIGMAVKRFMDLEAKSLEFRQELGLFADSTKDIESRNLPMSIVN